MVRASYRNRWPSSRKRGDFDDGLSLGAGSRHHQLPGDPVYPAGFSGVFGTDSLLAVLSAARLGGARSFGAAGQPAPGGGPMRGPERRAARSNRRGGVGQPAGNRADVGAGDRQAGGARHCLAVPADRGVLHPAAGAGVYGGHSGPDRAAAGRLFLRHQIPVAAGAHPRRPAAGGAGRAALRYGGQLAAVESHRGKGPCLGLLQLLPDHAL